MAPPCRLTSGAGFDRACRDGPVQADSVCKDFIKIGGFPTLAAYAAPEMRALACWWNPAVSSLDRLLLRDEATARNRLRLCKRPCCPSVSGGPRYEPHRRTLFENRRTCMRH